MAYIVTGTAGYDHIYPGDDAALNRGIFGSGDYFLATKEENPMAIEVTAGNIQLPKMEILMQGYHCRVIGDEVVTISNGSLGNNRIDVICGKYTKNLETMTDAFNIDIVKGTPTSGTPTAPEVTKGNIDAGQARYCPLFNVELQGLNVKSITRVIGKLVPIKESVDITAIKSSLGFNSNGVLSESNGGRLNYTNKIYRGSATALYNESTTIVEMNEYFPEGTIWLVIGGVNLSATNVGLKTKPCSVTARLERDDGEFYTAQSVPFFDMTTGLSLIAPVTGRHKLRIKVSNNAVPNLTNTPTAGIPCSASILAIRLF